MMIFLGPSFSLESLTRVHRMATSRIDKILQDLKAMTIGKLVIAVAQVYVMVDTKIIAPHINEFFYGIFVFGVMVVL